MNKSADILLTGASGFLGDYILKIFSRERIVTLSRKKGDVICDLGSEIPDLPFGLETVIHAAGKAHIVPKNNKEVAFFHEVNVTGTENLLKALTLHAEKLKSFIYISSVAVYGVEQGHDIDETFPLKGNTPYALSKIKSEQLILDWGNQHDVKVLILRLPLIVGTNPPGNLGAMIRAISKGYYFRFGEGKARKSVVNAENVALFIKENLQTEGIFNLTDGVHPSLYEIENALARHYGKKIKSMPVWVVKLLAKTGDFFPFFPINTLKLNKLNHSLTFSSQKAKSLLGWNPSPALRDFE